MWVLNQRKDGVLSVIIIPRGIAFVNGFSEKSCFFVALFIVFSKSTQKRSVYEESDSGSVYRFHYYYELWSTEIIDFLQISDLGYISLLLTLQKIDI